MKVPGIMRETLTCPYFSGLLSSRHGNLDKPSGLHATENTWGLIVGLRESL